MKLYTVAARVAAGLSVCTCLGRRITHTACNCTCLGRRITPGIRDRLGKILSVRPALYANVTQVMLLAIRGSFRASIDEWESESCLLEKLELMDRALRETDAADIGH